MFLIAVLMCTELDLHLPKTQKELIQLATGFDTISNAHSVFFGVIGAIDGWLCTTNKPSDVPNPGDFYSGHYKKFGSNVQGKCNAELNRHVVVVHFLHILVDILNYSLSTFCFILFFFIYFK